MFRKGLRGWGSGGATEADIPLFLMTLLEDGLPPESLEPWVQTGRLNQVDLAPPLIPLVGRAALLRALEGQFGVESFDLEATDLSPRVSQLIPPDLGAPLGVVCIAIDELGITLGMVDPTDDVAVAQVESKTDFKVVRRAVVLAPDLAAYQEMLYGTPRVLQVSPRDVVDDIIRRAVAQKASDIHIEPLEDDIRVRFRKDGILIDSYDISDVAPKKVILRHLKTALPVVVKNKSGSSGKTMNIAENQKPQDGRICLPGRDLEMRVSILPSVHGESIVIRIHTPEEEAGDFRRLGFSDEDLERFLPIIASPYGMLLVSGPTGSGKTTTLYTVLRRLNSPDRKILTVEDPVEYTIPGVIQVQTNPAKGVTFAEALRSFLRHDPDIIMVGEIRDRETAMMGVEASLTGHLVLSTIHANDTVRTITRVKDLGVGPLLLNSTCLATLAQRLVRTNCPTCSENVRFSDRFYELLEQFEIPYHEGDLRQGRGCERCNQTGYQGRVGVYELLVMSPEIRTLILEQAPDNVLEAEARKQGMKLLLEDALAKAAAGRTTEAEVLRVTLADVATTKENVKGRKARSRAVPVPPQPSAKREPMPVPAAAAAAPAPAAAKERDEPQRRQRPRRTPAALRAPRLIRDDLAIAWEGATA